MSWNEFKFYLFFPGILVYLFIAVLWLLHHDEVLAQDCADRGGRWVYRMGCVKKDLFVQ